MSIQTQTTELNKYEQQAIDFANKWGLGFDYQFVRHGIYFEDDKETRDIYKIQLSNKSGESYSFNFGQSLNKSAKNWPTSERVKPTLYDVLACLTKYDPGTFEEFCHEYGYNSSPLSDYPKVSGIYNSVVTEYANIFRLFGGNEQRMEELREIQ